MSRQDKIRDLIEQKSRRLHLLKMRQAQEGRKTDPADIIEIEDINKQLEKLQAELKELGDEAIERNRQNALPALESLPHEKIYTLIGALSLVVLVTLVAWYFVNPSRKDALCDQPIRTATTTIEITVASDEDINTVYMDSGAHVAFGKGSESLLLMSSMQCTAKQTGDGQIVYRAIVNMDVSDIAFGKPLRSLEEAEYIQIVFLPMPEQSQILAGKVTSIFNGETVLETNVPAQEITNGNIFVEDLRLDCGSN